MALRVLIGVLAAAYLVAPGVAAARSSAVGLELRGEPIGRIEVRAPAGVDEKRARDLFGLEVGRRLSVSEVRRAVERLYASGLYSDVIVRARRRAGKVVVTLEVAPRLKLREIRVAGNAVIPGDDLRRDFNFTPDQEYSPDMLPALEQSVLTSYRRRGYYRTQVDLQLQRMEGDRVRILVDVQEGPPTRIARLEFLGQLGLGVSVLRRRLDVSAGDLLDEARLRRGVDALRSLYKSQGYYEARIQRPRIELPTGSETAVVRFSIQAGSRTTIHWSGARGFSRKWLVKQLQLKDERRMNQELVTILCDRLRRALRDRGFYRARVAGTLQVDKKARRKRFVFRLVPGPRVRVLAVRFPGARSVPARELRELVLSLVEERVAEGSGLFDGVHPSEVAREFGVGRPGGGITAEGYSALPLRPREIYLESAYRAATEQIVQLYKSRGFTQVRVDEGKVLPVPDSADVTVEYRIFEGVRTFVRSVRFVGHRVLTQKELREDLKLQFRKPYNPNQVEKTRTAIRRRYERLGYIYVRVEDRETFTKPTPKEVDVTFRIEEGPRVRVGRILVEGNVKTKTAVIKDVLTVRPGDIYDPERISESQQNLFNLGLFTAASLERVDRDQPERYKNLRVVVRERKPGLVEAGIGFSTGDGPRGFFNLSYANLFGYNLQASLYAKFNYQLFIFADDTSRSLRFSELSSLELLERQITLSLNYPKILGVPFPLGARIDYIHQRQSQLSFGLDKNAVVTSLEVKLAKAYRAQLQYELEFTSLQPVLAVGFSEEIGLITDLSQQAALRRTDIGDVTLWSGRAVVSADLRDSPFNPTRGIFASVTGEYTSTVTQKSDLTPSYFKLQGTLTGYLPLGRRTVLALQASWGRIFHLSEASRTPRHRRFFLGGRGSIRGYPEESIIPPDRAITAVEAARLFSNALPPFSFGGDVYYFGRAELRFPVSGKLSAAIFFDMGNLWDSAENASLGVRPRMSAGVGIRYPTPVGPLSLDYGVNLSRRFVVAEDSLGVVRPVFFEGFGALHFSIGVF